MKTIRTKLLVSVASPLAMLCFGTAAHAGIGAVIDPQSESAELRIVPARNVELEPRPNVRLTISIEPICATLGSRNLAQARIDSSEFPVLVARYNLVNLWMGSLCGGKSDAMPTNAEAKAWLLGLADEKFQAMGGEFYDSQNLLAQMYLFGAPGVNPDYSAALDFLNEKAKANWRDANLYLSYMYQEGLGVRGDKARAYELIKSAPPSHNSARVLIAQAIEMGEHENRDAARAFKEYLDVSRTGNVPAIFKVGVMYFDGKGIAKDDCQAKSFLQRVAEVDPSLKPNAALRLDKIEKDKSCPQAMRAERTMITSKAGSASGGINTATMSRGYGGGANLSKSGDPPKAASGPTLTREEIELVFERNRGAIYSVYSRALRDNPDLKGKVVLEIAISAAGEVTDCIIVSSELNDPELERKIVARVKMFRFEPRAAAPPRITKSIDLFPA